MEGLCAGRWVFLRSQYVLLAQYLINEIHKGSFVLGFTILSLPGSGFHDLVEHRRHDTI